MPDQRRRRPAPAMWSTPTAPCIRASRRASASRSVKSLFAHGGPRLVQRRLHLQRLLLRRRRASTATTACRARRRTTSAPKCSTSIRAASTPGRMSNGCRRPISSTTPISVTADAYALLNFQDRLRQRQRLVRLCRRPQPARYALHRQHQHRRDRQRRVGAVRTGHRPRDLRRPSLPHVRNDLMETVMRPVLAACALSACNVAVVRSRHARAAGSAGRRVLQGGAQGAARLRRLADAEAARAHSRRRRRREADAKARLADRHGQRRVRQGLCDVSQLGHRGREGNRVDRAPCRRQLR